MKNVLALSPAFLAAALTTAPAYAEKVPSVALSNKTMVFQSVMPKVSGNIVRFSIDASHVNAFNYMASDRIAIIPKGESRDNFRECPYLPYKKEGNKVEQAANRPGRIMNITTRLTDDQMEAIKKARCVVTDWPPLTDILGLNK